MAKNARQKVWQIGLPAIVPALVIISASQDQDNPYEIGQTTLELFVSTLGAQAGSKDNPRILNALASFVIIKDVCLLIIFVCYRLRRVGFYPIPFACLI